MLSNSLNLGQVTAPDLEALLEQEAVFQRLADFFPQLMWMANPDGWIYWYNQPWYVYTGATPEQMQGWGWQSVHHPDILPEVMERWQAAIASQKPFEMTFPLKGADGEFRCFLTRIVPLKNGEGQVVRWFGANTDISEQVAIKQVLTEEARRQQALIHFQSEMTSSAPTDIYQRIVDGCLDVVPTADAAVVELIDGENLTYEAVSGRLAKFDKLTLKHNGSLSGMAMQLGQPLICRDTEHDPRVDLASCRKVNIRSMIVLPITRLGETVGVLKLASALPNQFSDTDVNLGQLLVSVISSAFSNLAEAQALEEVEQQEAKFKQVLNVLPGVFWMADSAGQCHFISDQWEDYTGQPIKETLGFGWLAVVHPDDLARTEQRWRDSVETKKPYEIEYRFRMRDGHYRWFFSRAFPVLDDHQHVKQWYGSSIDIHDRKLAENALKESEWRFRFIADAAPLMIWMVDTTGCLTYCNHTMLEFFNCSENDMLARQAWRTLIHPDDLTWVKNRFANCLENRIAFEMEFRVKHQSGQFFWLLLAGVPRYNETGDFLGLIGSGVNVNDRKRTEAALIQAKAEYQSLAFEREAILSQLTEGVIITDQQGKIIFLNDAAARLHGVSTLDVAPEQYTETYHLYTLDGQPYPPEQLPLYRAIKYQDTVLNARWCIRRPDGTEVVAIGNAKPVHRSDGTLIGAVLAFQDDTERQAYENALKASEAHYRFVSNSTPVMLWLTDDQHQCTYLNQTWRDYTGQTMEEGLGLGWLDKIHPDDIPLVKQRFFDATAKLAPFSFDYRLQTRTGDYRWAMDCGAPLIGPDNEFRGYTGYVIDISDRKVAEENLRKSEERFKAAVSAVQGILWTNNAKGEMEGPQPGWEALTGQHYQDYQGYGWTQVIHPDDIQPTLDGWHQSLASKQPFVCEHRVRRQNGAWGRFSVRAIPTFDDNGAILEWVGVHTDITQQREAQLALKASEQALQQLNEQLEQRVIDRTAQLQAINKELEAFSYSVSHDLRAPLRSITGFSQAILREYGSKLDPTATDYLNRVCVNTMKMSDLIDAMLQLSRLTRVEIRKEWVNLSDMAETIAADLQQQEPDRMVTFDIAPHIEAFADARLIRIALENLLGNSWKYTSHHATAHIAFGTITDAGQTYYFVQDDGAGFEMQYIDKLFGAFQRLHGMQEFPGTGVGLATTARIIRRHGGQLWATAELEKGATFYFSLENLKTRPDSYALYLRHVDK